MHSLIVALIATACIFPCQAQSRGLFQNNNNNNRGPQANSNSNNTNINSTNNNNVNSTENNNNNSCPQLRGPYVAPDAAASAQSNATYLLVAAYSLADPVALVSVYQVTDSSSLAVSFLTQIFAIVNNTSSNNNSSDAASNSSSSNASARGDHNHNHNRAPFDAANVSDVASDSLPALPDGAAYDAAGLTCAQVRAVWEAVLGTNNDQNNQNNNQNNNNNGGQRGNNRNGPSAFRS